MKGAIVATLVAGSLAGDVRNNIAKDGTRKIKHMVQILMENRPIDHTFGCMAGEGIIGLEGINGTGPSSGFAWHRETLRISDTPRTFSMHIATHAACWRPALGFSVERFPQHWHVVAAADKVSQVDGLGSYGSFPIPMLGETGSLNDPAIAKMHCTRR